MAASRRPSPLMLELLHVLANRWGDYLQGSGLRAVQKRQALLLSMLGEIHDSVGAIQDLDRLLSVMVETMHRLTGGVFSGLALFGLRGRAEEVQMVSKGLNAEQVARYAGELSERYLALESKASRPKDRKPVFRKTGWGAPALEIPLYDGRRIAGVLSVGLSEKRAGEAERFFLSSLALIGELRLFELRQQEPASGRNALELLGHSFSFWDPEAHSSLLRKRDLLAEFAGRLGFSSEGRKRLDQALTVSGYGMSFLWETIPGHADALLLLDEAQSVIAHRGQADAYLEFGYSQEAQVLALVIGHPGADGGIQSVALGIRAAFEELLEDRMPSVSLVAVGNAWTRRDEEEPAYATLTLREREVLELLIQGCTNQDIAEKMFISAHTVKNHLTKIYMKLGVVDRTAAMVKLLRN
ncbi:hypothetical protein E6C55_15280 [Cohnella fermenti]|uniref:HTH luxR-type domain-containing protein n=2 Tax=Cohnella fermenti TaxID=2565925 RepID=A0A4S4BY73_9BACL|nr:hypothetical protein E6C55_15280 [Cohnella fermenti]